MRALFAFVLTAALGAVHAAAPPVVAKVQDWTIVKTTDAMSDRTACSALYDRDHNIMLRADMLLVWMKGRGGVKAYQFRYDKEPPSLLADRMPTDSPDFWWTGDLEKVFASTKLLVRIQPVIGNIVDLDINLRGAKLAHDVLVSPRCQ